MALIIPDPDKLAGEGDFPPDMNNTFEVLALTARAVALLCGAEPGTKEDAVAALSGVVATGAIPAIPARPSGTADLSGGTATVTTDQVTTDALIYLTIQVPGGTPGAVYVSARTDGASFTITSTSGSDSSTVAWEIAV
jgi:hypothetical protein